MKTWLYRIGVIFGITTFSLAVWFAGSMIGFSEYRPLDGVWIRLAIIGFVLACFAAYYGIRYMKRRKAAKALEKAMLESEENAGDAKVLGDKMAEALATLKRSSGKSAYLYDLPWYVIIGPPAPARPPRW